ncbi:hypothetical protein [Nitrosovibrio sp. Nv4]|uniref:hypothetical protein n=1 Tax=Nitrosovibrio sp. Nv4 TaxID=1945880 RepID=UPI000D443CC4|nr:hypothetical protein [Nitrosovibrio sp. Nv4]
MTHITGPSRHQTTLFPESLDEFNCARSSTAINRCIVDSLDLGQFGVQEGHFRSYWTAAVRTGGFVKAVRVRLPEPGAFKPHDRAGNEAQTSK